jgi:hypothetical protein
MAHVSVILDKNGRLNSFTGDMAQGIEFDRDYNGHVTKILIAGQLAAKIDYS